MELKHTYKSRPGESACAEMPDLRRLNYFYGQMLGVQDFRTEQAYFRDKHKLHNRCLHGHGTVCGLLVAPEPPAHECKSPADAERAAVQLELDRVAAQIRKAHDAKDEARVKELAAREEGLWRELDALGPAVCDPFPAPRVVLECGLALDCEGNEIIVPRAHAIDPWHWLTADDRKRVQEANDGIDLYLSICYCEQPVDPVRSVLANACGSTPECTHGKLRDGYKLHITTEAPPRDGACDTCCTACAQPCLLLAVLLGYRHGEGVRAIDNSVRRVVETTAYPSATITGISWTHGASYTFEEAAAIIGSTGSTGGTAGIQVNFSRPVFASTLRKGVVEVRATEGGRGKSAGIYALDGEFEDFGGEELVDSFRFRYVGNDNLSPGDRVTIIVRCAFVLDACCRPVDGAHVGGLVPIIDTPEFEKFDRTEPQAHCALKPGGYGPWTSGAGTPGASFESWFFVETNEAAKQRQQGSRK